MMSAFHSPTRKKTRSQPNPSDGEAGKLFFRQKIVPLVVSGLVFGLFVLLGYGTWNRVRDEITVSEHYRLNPEKIYITELPAWVPATLVQDVLSSASLNEHQTVITNHFLDDMATAFSAHPWVDEVVRIRMEYPATIHADLKYREAICLVRLEKPDGNDSESHDYYPVDHKGVYLPTDHFLENPGGLSRLIRIENVNTRPTRSVGSPWGDPAVEQAAEIASLIFDLNHLLHITTIRPKRNAIDRQIILTFQLVTSGNTVIDWGRHQDEQSETLKVEKLRELAREYGSLDNAALNDGIRL